jgi:hypothetical protein
VPPRPAGDSAGPSPAGLVSYGPMSLPFESAASELAERDPSSPDILRLLVDNHARFLGFLERRVGSRDEAEEILQEAFVRSIGRTDALQTPESATAWFYRVLRNALIDHHRREGTRRRAFLQLAAEAEGETVAADQERPQCPGLRRGGRDHAWKCGGAALPGARGAAAPACPELRDLPRTRLPRLPLRRATLTGAGRRRPRAAPEQEVARWPPAACSSSRAGPTLEVQSPSMLRCRGVLRSCPLPRARCPSHSQTPAAPDAVTAIEAEQVCQLTLSCRSPNALY